MVDAVALNKGKVEGAAIGGAGGTVVLEVPCPLVSTLVVEADMTGAVNGDLGVAVQPYEVDGVTLLGVNLPTVQNVGPTFAGGRVTQFSQYDVTAIDKVRITLTNNNAGAQTVTRASWRLA
jgi:hypothetical protein